MTAALSTEPGSLRRAADQVRSGRTTARELVERSLRRIAAHPELNAVVSDRANDARADADALDAVIADRGEGGPLAGLPVLVKDNSDVRGMVTTHGSRWFERAAPATADSTVVARLRAAGAIPVGKTNLPEFSIEGFTDNLLFGPTKNPWDPDRSPGGSSGGSAAALAAGLAPIATGTDGGGSVRIPAAFCGLLGYKPTHGVIGRWPAPDWIDLSTDGLLATSVDDLRRLLSIVAGPVPGDPTAPPRGIFSAALPSRLIVADRTDDLGPLPPDVAEALHTSAAELAAVLQVPLGSLEPGALFPGWSPDEDWFVIAAAEHAAVVGRDRIRSHTGQLHPSTAEFLSFGVSVTKDDYLAARRRRFDAVRRLDLLLADGTALVTPAVAVAGWGPDGRIGDHPPALLGPEVYSTAIQNMVGVPAISLPAGHVADGMPFGMQVTMPRWSDLALLELAARWELAHPWPRTAPGYEEFA